MNYEIDLRPPESITKRKKIRPSTFLIIFSLLLLFTLVGIYTLLEISYNNLLYQVDQFETELTGLNYDAAPLVLLKEEILKTNRKVKLEAELTARSEPISLIIRQLRMLSPFDLYFTDITVNRDLTLEIFGYCNTMQTVADYLQSLEKSCMIYKSDLAIINMTENSNFNFRITGTINQGEHIYENENQ